MNLKQAVRRRILETCIEINKAKKIYRPRLKEAKDEKGDWLQTPTAL